jgi:hypothetical protein
MMVLIALYTNYTKYAREIWEGEYVLEEIKEMLNLPADTKPMWYWDDENDDNTTLDPSCISLPSAPVFIVLVQCSGRVAISFLLPVCCTCIELLCRANQQQRILPT